MSRDAPFQLLFHIGRHHPFSGRSGSNHFWEFNGQANLFDSTHRLAITVQYWTNGSLVRSVHESVSYRYLDFANSFEKSASHNVWKILKMYFNIQFKAVYILYAQ